MESQSGKIWRLISTSFKPVQLVKTSEKTMRMRYTLNTRILILKYTMGIHRVKQYDKEQLAHENSSYNDFGEDF